MANQQPERSQQAAQTPAPTPPEQKAGQQAQKQEREERKERAAGKQQSTEPAAARGGGLSLRPGAMPSALLSGQLLGLSPFGFIRRMMEDMDRLLADFGGGGDVLRRGDTPGALGMSWSPQVELVQRGDELVVRADLPGLDPDDVQIRVTDDDTLVIEGERRFETEQNQGGLYRSERGYGFFHREIPLPDGVDLDAASAEFKDGVLEVRLKLPEQRGRGRRIDVKGRGEKREESGKGAGVQ